MSKQTTALALTVFCLGACSHHTTESTTGNGDDTNTVVQHVRPTGIGTGHANHIPKATAIRINPEYADKVAISIADNGVIRYYPAPGDITSDSAPLPLGDGWYLNRQGVPAGSVFTRYTFSQYAALSQAPSLQQLRDSVIPGSAVIEVRTLPCNINEAPEQINEIRSYLGIEK